MMIINLTSNKFGTVEVLIDPEDAHFFNDYSLYVWQSSRHRTGYVLFVQCKRNGKYAGKRLHRVICKAPKELYVDHINGNGLDNRKSNLRLVTPSKNNRNCRKRVSAKTSKFKGVHKNKKGLWVAQIQVNKKKLILGIYSTELEAAKAYNTKAVEYFGEYAKLNDLDLYCEIRI